jgi:4'-phosphopantetheinyl transferase
MATEDFPTSPSNLPEHEVHLWRLKLEQPEQHVDEFISLLSSEEQRRAAKFRFERDRNRFVVARGVLRTILASYLNYEPDQLELSYGPYGKPYVPHRSYAIQFNLAHSHEVVLYAFALERNVGVDVEQIRELPDVEQMATTYLTEQENAVFKSLPRGRKSRAFFESWTRKEAYLKAIGTGLAQPFTRINPSITFGWSIMSFTPDPDYVAALAIEGQDSFSVLGTTIRELHLEFGLGCLWLSQDQVLSTPRRA